MARDLARITTRLQIETAEFGKGLSQSATQVRRFANRMAGGADGVKITINQVGLAELEAKIKALGPRLQGNILRQVAREASKPVVERARATVPVGTRLHKTYKGRIVSPGFAKRSIKLETFLTRDKSAAIALVGVRREAYYALQFLELGTARIPRRPWLKPAFEATAGQQVQLVLSALKKRIERYRG